MPSLVRHLFDLFLVRLRDLEFIESGKQFTFSAVTASESKGDLAVNPEWHRRRPLRLPLHSKCRMGIASTASDEIQSRLDE